MYRFSWQYLKNLILQPRSGFAVTKQPILVCFVGGYELEVLSIQKVPQQHVVNARNSFVIYIYIWQI